MERDFFEGLRCTSIVSFFLNVFIGVRRLIWGARTVGEVKSSGGVEVGMEASKWHGRLCKNCK